MAENPDLIRHVRKSTVTDTAEYDLFSVQTNTSTYYLMQDTVTGEIGFSTNSTTFIDAGIGSWDGSTRTARLTHDINQTLEILINNVTLTGLKPDSTKHVIDGHTGIGIFINNKHDITIENIEIKNCNAGISISQSTNILIQNNYIHDNAIGIYFNSSCDQNTIRYNSIYNNDVGIGFFNENEFNVIQNNEIYDNRNYGITFVTRNVSNTIQYNNIYRNGQSGIYFDIPDNNSNIIPCNRIANNGSNYAKGGVYIRGYNNQINNNNFIDNIPYNAYNYKLSTNTYTGNYWSDWDGTGPYTFNDNGVDNNPSKFLNECAPNVYTLFKQFSVQEYLTIPEQKPCAEEIIKCLVDVEIAHVKVIKTPKAQSHEGQVLKGYKAIIHGNLHQKLEYIADEPTQSVHAAHFISPFSTYIMLEEDYVMGTPLHITPTIEDVYYKLLDKMHIFKNVTIYLEAKET